MILDRVFNLFSKIMFSLLLHCADKNVLRNNLYIETCDEKELLVIRNKIFVWMNLIFILVMGTYYENQLIYCLFVIIK